MRKSRKNNAVTKIFVIFRGFGDGRFLFVWLENVWLENVWLENV
jgi:hypothetical protein